MADGKISLAKTFIKYLSIFVCHTFVVIRVISDLSDALVFSEQACSHASLLTLPLVSSLQNGT